MAAIGNGLDAYGGFLPYTATFLNFLEYCFPAVRLAALSHHRHLFVMTHDSIGLGEDGPTHQPIEVLSLCRATPNLLTFRPADGKEVVGSYIEAVKYQGPSVLALTRQNVPHLEHSRTDGVAKGGYVVHDEKDVKVIFVATGSEVPIAIDAAKKLKAKGLGARVVSMPCTALFDKQSVGYRREVITPGVPTISVEALATVGWEKYSHYQIGMRTFGSSAPYQKLYDFFGFTPDKVATVAQKFLQQVKAASEEMRLPSSHASPLLTHFNASL
jgi:transketolase